MGLLRCYRRNGARRGCAGEVVAQPQAVDVLVPPAAVYAQHDLELDIRSPPALHWRQSPAPNAATSILHSPRFHYERRNAVRSGTKRSTAESKYASKQGERSNEVRCTHYLSAGILGQQIRALFAQKIYYLDALVGTCCTR